MSTLVLDRPMTAVTLFVLSTFALCVAATVLAVHNPERDGWFAMGGALFVFACCFGALLIWSFRLHPTW